MNDPWADVRERHQALTSGPRTWEARTQVPLLPLHDLLQHGLPRLLADADALLATLEKIAGMNEPLDEAAYHPADAVWMRTAARQALAALLEHLK